MHSCHPVMMRQGALSLAAGMVSRPSPPGRHSAVLENATHSPSNPKGLTCKHGQLF